MIDHYELQRFLAAQDAGDTYARAVGELRDGRKRSHWMWFVFPQIAGLGRSPTAQHFAISGLPEAMAYLAHPVLAARLLECARVLTQLFETDPVKVLGPVDAKKLQSSMTLFSQVAPDQRLFQEVLDQYFGGASDGMTVASDGGDWDSNHEESGVTETNDWNESIIAEFRANDGRVGGMFEGAPMTLLHHRGRKSSRDYVTPVMYLPVEGDASSMYVFASKAGEPTHPDWYYNLTAAGVAQVEVGTETFDVTVQELAGEERDRVFEEQVRRYPGFGEYEVKTAGIRTIPVLALQRA